ncbi:MAG: ABC transporter substrate-binding protein [Nitrospinae bacterium]|nr:ABC transporter substrate-binding protein [Nitrospinota bacterium]
MMDRLLGMLRAAPFLALALLLAPSLSAAAPGVSAEAVVFGQTVSISGPARRAGLLFQSGLNAALDERNARGGVGGRVLKLISLDDGYEPQRAAANAKRFAAENDVLALIGGTGTPTTKRAAPVLRNAGIPLVGVLSGADFLRDAKRYPNLVHLRASYSQEVRALVDHIVRYHGKKRFGIIYQDDAFGRSILKSYRAALAGHKLRVLAKASFSRNTHAVHAGLFVLQKADLDVLMIGGTGGASAEIINLANDLGYGYIMTILSIAQSESLRRRLKAPSGKIMMSEVLPDANDASRKIVRSFQRAMLARAKEKRDGSVQPAFSQLSLEGYILGRFVIAVLERTGGEVTRKRFLQEALAAGEIRIDDWAVEFKPGTNFGSKYVRMTESRELRRFHERRRRP